jgi:hypothetical protein
MFREKNIELSKSSKVFFNTVGTSSPEEMAVRAARVSIGSGGLKF